MSSFTKFFVGLMAFSAVGLPYMATYRGWGIGTERNASVIGRSGAYCPSYTLDSTGRCRSSHRSYYYGRSRSGGGFLFGK